MTSAASSFTLIDQIFVLIPFKSNFIHNYIIIILSLLSTRFRNIFPGRGLLYQDNKVVHTGHFVQEEMCYEM